MQTCLFFRLFIIFPILYLIIVSRSKNIEMDGWNPNEIKHTESTNHMSDIETGELTASNLLASLQTKVTQEANTNCLHVITQLYTILQPLNPILNTSYVVEVSRLILIGECYEMSS